MYKRIRELREDHDKKQVEVANLLNISQQYYSEYEKGKRPIPVEKLKILANIYETSVDYIVELTDETKPYSKTKKKKSS